MVISPFSRLSVSIDKFFSFLQPVNVERVCTRCRIAACRETYLQLHIAGHILSFDREETARNFERGTQLEGRRLGSAASGLRRKWKKWPHSWLTSVLSVLSHTIVGSSRSRRLAVWQSKSSWRVGQKWPQQRSSRVTERRKEGRKKGRESVEDRREWQSSVLQNQ